MLPGHYLIFLIKYNGDEIYEFKMEIATSPIRIAKHEIKFRLTNNDGFAQKFNGNEEYDQIFFWKQGNWLKTQESYSREKLNDICI